MQFHFASKKCRFALPVIFYEVFTHSRGILCVHYLPNRFQLAFFFTLEKQIGAPRYDL